MGEKNETYYVPWASRRQTGWSGRLHTDKDCQAFNITGPVKATEEEIENLRLCATCVGGMPHRAALLKTNPGEI